MAKLMVPDWAPLKEKRLAWTQVAIEYLGGRWTDDLAWFWGPE